MRQNKEEAGAERSRERLGASIRRRRVELGKSRKDLERESGLSYPFLTEIEAGKKWPSSKTLARIAETLEVDPGELMNLGEAVPERDGVFDARLAPMSQAAVSPSAPVPAPPPVAAAAAPPPPAESVKRTLWARASAPEPDDRVAELAKIARELPDRDLELLLDFARRMDHP